MPANPLDVLAQQVVADHRARRLVDVDDLFDAGPAQRAVRRSCRASAYDATLDLLSGPLPLRRVRRAAPAHRVGPGHRHAHRPARAPSGWRSPAAARSPTAGCSGSSWSAARGRAGGSASSTRRWSTSRGSATSSRSARPAGGSRTSPTTGCWSPRRPASPGGCRSGRATRSAGPPSSARRSAPSPASSARCRARSAVAAGPRDDGLDEWAAGNLVGYVHEQLEATNVLPSDRTLVVERFRDELGDWRLVVHSPYGTPVHAPWALAINARLRERYGVDGQAVASDDGIVIRIPDTDAEPPGRRGDRLRAPTRSRTSSPRRSAARRCSRRGSASARPGRCCSPAATPAGARRCGSSGSAPRRCSRSPRSTRRSRSCSRPCASACRTSTTCPRWSR